MAMFDTYMQVQWQELYEFFSSGRPPLALQLLAINTIFLILFMLKRMRGMPNLRPETARVVQAFLLAANFAIVFQQDIFGHPLIAL
jgi:hypothetical protein